MELDCMKLPVVTNFGVEKSLADKIVLLDGDRVAPAGYYQRVLKQVELGIQITCKNIQNLPRPTEDWEIERGKYDYIEEHRSEEKMPGRKCMWSGNTTFMKQDFYRAGRMDEAYRGYGFEDHDMTYTMEAAGVKSIYLPEEIELHLWHERQTYGVGDEATKKGMFIDNGLFFCKKWKQPLPEFLREDIANHRKAWI